MLRTFVFVALFFVFSLPSCQKTLPSQEESSADAAPSDGILKESIADAEGLTETSELPPETSELPPESLAESLPEKPPSAAYPRLQNPVLSEPASGPTNVRIQPSLAFGSDGSLGMSYTSGSGADNKLGIFFLRLKDDGQALGSWVRLDTLAGGNNTESSLCALAGGGYVAAWSSDTGNFDPVEGNLQLHFRVLKQDGSPLHTESTRVKTALPGNHWLPKVACTNDGGFLLAGVNVDDSLSFGVFVQRFDSQGQAKGDAVAANTEVAGTQTYPNLGVTAEGTGVVVWEDGTDGQEAKFRIFPPAPTPPSSVFSLSPDGSASSKRPSISVDPASGNFLIALRQGGGPFRLVAYKKDGSNPETRSFPDTQKVNYAQPTLLPLGQDGHHALLYIKGASESSSSPTLAILGPPEVQQGPFVVATGRIPSAYRPSLAYHKGRLAVAWTERTAVQGGFTVKIASFR